MRKTTSILIISLFVISILAVGCQPAAKKPMDDGLRQDTRQTSDQMTENERRVLAGRLANLAEEVQGVEKASVIVSEIDITPNMPDNVPNNLPNNVPNNTPGVTPRTTTPANPTNNMMNPGNTPGTNVNNSVNNNQGMNTPESLAPGANQATDTNTNITRNGLVVMVGLTMEGSRNNDSDLEGIKQTVADRIRGADSRITQVMVTSDPKLIKRINDVAAGLLEGKPIKNFESKIKDLGRDLRQEMPAF